MTKEPFEACVTPSIASNDFVTIAFVIISFAIFVKEIYASFYDIVSIDRKAWRDFALFTA